MTDAFAPARLGPVQLRNRIVKAATFEGVTREHVVSPKLIEFHREVARGGVGLTTVAYCAVSADGCGTPNEIILTDDAVPGMAELADAVHAEGAAVSAQIGHAGAVAAATGHRGLAPSRIFSPLAMRFAKAVDEADIARITGDFAGAARRVADAGFDAVELHLGHGYLLLRPPVPGGPADAAGPAGRHQPAGHHRAGDGGGVRARGARPGAAAGARPGRPAAAGRHRRGVVHPPVPTAPTPAPFVAKAASGLLVYMVHADDLPGHPLRDPVKP